MPQQINLPAPAAQILARAGALIEQGRLEESEQLLATLPDSVADEPAVQAQRAVLAAQRGRLDEAEAAFRSLLDVYPRADLACNLGLVLLQKRENAKALKMFVRALAMPACPPVAHKHAGRLLLRSNQPLPALEHFRALAGMQASNHENLADLGLARLANNETTEAEQRFRDALALSDQYSVAWHGLAQSLHKQNRIDEAIEAYRRAIELAEDTLAIEVDLAILYETSNQLDNAAQMAEDILRRHPGQAHAMLVRARCLRRRGQPDEAAGVLQALLDSGVASEQQQSTCHHLMGRISDEAGDTDAAFTHFANGNRVAARLIGASGNEANAYVAHAIQVQRWATPKMLSRIAAASAADSRQPVFLIGFPRSGTTLLDQLLDAHPQIQVMEEKPAVTAMQRHFRTQHTYPDDIAALTAPEIDKLRSIYFDLVDQHLVRRDDSVLVDKLPLNIVAVPFIHKVFPGARYIVALRHPCDVCLSCFMQEFEPNVATLNFFSLAQIADLYAAVMNLWRTVADDLPLNMRIQRYEDLVDDLEGQTRDLIAFLGLDFDPGVLQFQEHARRRGSINTPSYDQVSRPLYRDARYRWPRYRSHLEPLLEQLAPLIEAFDYKNV